MSTKPTHDHVEQVLEELIEEYNLDGDDSPYYEYISALIVDKITKCEPSVSEEEKDDWCISIWLTKPSPLKPRWQYKGVKVFIEVTGVGSTLHST